MEQGTKPDWRSKLRQLEGSRRGAALVRAEFADALTRRRFAQAVGVHLSTVRRWEAAGIVRPFRLEILNSPTWVFSAEDVPFGRRLARILRERSGAGTLQEAAALAREESES